MSDLVGNQNCCLVFLGFFLLFFLYKESNELNAFISRARGLRVKKDMKMATMTGGVVIPQGAPRIHRDHRRFEHISTENFLFC